MERCRIAWLVSFALIVAVALGSSIAGAEETEPKKDKSDEPAEKLASFAAPLAKPKQRRTDHPLYPALVLAEEALESIDKNIDDYTCKIVRRERVAGKLGKYEFINAKVRHEQGEGEEKIPFSVYLRFDKPAAVEGREALYISGTHGDRVLVRRGGQRMAYMSTYLKPDSRLAMRENRYPITDLGFKRLVEQLVGVIENDMQHDECKVTFFKGAKVDERTCTRIEVIHPVERDHFTFHKAMVFVDDKDKIPVGYASFFWPREEGGKPLLLEEYIYTDVKLNVGLSDDDFDRENPEYLFSQDPEESDEE